MSAETTDAKLCSCDNPLCWRLHPSRMLTPEPELIVIREPDHRCPLGSPMFRHGEIVALMWVEWFLTIIGGFAFSFWLIDHPFRRRYDQSDQPRSRSS